MQFSNALLSLLALSFTTTALPTVASNSEELEVGENTQDLEARSYFVWMDVYLDSGFRGGQEAGATTNVCSKMFYRKDKNNFKWYDFSDRISSINVRDGTRCQFWEHNDCKGRYWYGSRVENLADGDGYMNDKISSYKCYGN